MGLSIARRYRSWTNTQVDGYPVERRVVGKIVQRYVAGIRKLRSESLVTSFINAIDRMGYAVERYIQSLEQSQDKNHAHHFISIATVERKNGVGAGAGGPLLSAAKTWPTLDYRPSRLDIRWE